jgi:hypothetical protein
MLSMESLAWPSEFPVPMRDMQQPWRESRFMEPHYPDRPDARVSRSAIVGATAGQYPQDDDHLTLVVEAEADPPVANT